MVRPKNVDGTLRDHLVMIRYTAEEFAAIQKKYAKTQYPSLAAFLRTITLGKNIIVTSLQAASSETDNDLIKKREELRTEIARIGNNINQIAKLCNSKKYAGKAELSAIIIELHKIHDLLNSKHI